MEFRSARSLRSPVAADLKLPLIEGRSMTRPEHEAWHREVIPDSTHTTLGALRDSRLVDLFYLAGGTGLALYFGHRISRDLDFFAPDHFNEDSLLQRVQVLSGFALIARAPFTLHATIQGTRLVSSGTLIRSCIRTVVLKASRLPIRATSRV
jgi:hypothetical protein